MANKRIFFLLFLFLINFAASAILIKSGNKIQSFCERNVHYIIIDVIFSGKPPKDQYPFTLNLAAPEKLNFKCMLDYNKAQIFCFRAFSDDADFIKKLDYLQIPYPFPEIEDIVWDYESFLKNVYRKVLISNATCGTEDLFNVTSKNYKEWDIKGKIQYLHTGKCLPKSVTNEEIDKYQFSMKVSFEGGEIINLLTKNDGAEIELLQEIWTPILPRDKKKKKEPTYKRGFPFAYCSSDEKITKKNYQGLNLNCYIPIKPSTIYNGIIRISSFFDKFFIKQNNKISLVSAFIDILEDEDTYNEENGEVIDEEEKPYVTLFENDAGIICPNQPVFTISSTDDIMMADYYNYTSAHKFSFYLFGTLSNGFYVYKNGTTVNLEETYKSISFNLIYEDNLIENDDDEKNATCTLQNGSPFNLEGEAVIKCVGNVAVPSNTKRNVDITVSWGDKFNSNFNDIIIRWPMTYDESNKKNIYQYKLTGLSIRQSDFGCHNNNFDFYVYIYNLYREPKISFTLPLSSPKGCNATCEIFDPTALKCSLRLKHKKLSKGEKVMLPEMGTETKILTNEGNKIIFTMNNYSTINNDHDFYVKLEESCGDYMVVGTLKDMGMSHKTSIAVYILIIVFIILVIVGFVFYCMYKIRLRIKRGVKLTTSEEKKEPTNTNNTTTANNTTTGQL